LPLSTCDTEPLAESLLIGEITSSKSLIDDYHARRPSYIPLIEIAAAIQRRLHGLKIMRADEVETHFHIFATLWRVAFDIHTATRSIEIESCSIDQAYLMHTRESLQPPHHLL